MTIEQPGNNVVAGWYPDASGRTQWWDGTRWSGQYAPTPQPHQFAPQQPQQRQANGMNVSYVRQQKGHSLVLHLLLGWIVLYIPTIYFAVSPNHYFHA